MIIIPISQIRLRNYNRDTQDDVSSLAESIREHGLINPVIVTEIKKNQYQLIAGERRLRAVQANGGAEIGCNLFAADELQQQKLNLAENLQRKDLTIWEEAKHVQELKDLQPEARVEDIAAQVGRSAPWVAHRLQLSKLHPELQKIFQTQNWPISHVSRLARYSRDFQGKIAQEIRKRQGQYSHGWVDHLQKKAGSFPSLSVLIEFIDNFTMLLKSAIWKLDDAEILPKAGACSACPKRSSQQGLLFQEPGDDDVDTCLDPECFSQKKVEYIKLNIKKLKEDKQKPVYLGNTYDKAIPGLPKADTEHWNVREVKKSTPGAMPAIHVSGRDLGKTVWVVKDRDRYGQTVRQESQRKINQETGKPTPPSNKERLQVLLNKRLCAAVEFWRNGTLSVLKPHIRLLLPIVAVFGTESRASSLDPHTWKDYDLVEKGGEEKRTAKIYEEVFPVLADRCRRTGTLDQGMELWAEAVRQSQALESQPELLNCWNSALQEVKFPNALKKAGVEDPHKPDFLPVTDKKPTKK